MSQKYPEPYKHIPPTGMDRLQTEISIEHKQLIQSLCPGRGILNYVIQSYITSLVAECKQRNITNFSLENRDAFLEVIRNRTNPRPDLPVSGPNGCGPVESVHTPHSDSADLAPNVLKDSSRRSGLGRGSTGSKTKKRAKVEKA